MSEHDKAVGSDGVPNADQAFGKVAEGERNATEDGAGEPDLFKVIDALNTENASLKDRSLRALADAENARRRAERDVADAKAYGVTSFARDMLTVSDNLRRALESLPAGVKEQADGGLKSFIDGIELTERDFLTTLGRFGVKKIEPLGHKFDPNLHQAMFEVADESVPHGTVKQVMQSGFTIQGRVLRPAMVGVAKGGAKAVPGAETAPASGTA